MRMFMSIFLAKAGISEWTYSRIPLIFQQNLICCFVYSTCIYLLLEQENNKFYIISKQRKIQNYMASVSQEEPRKVPITTRGYKFDDEPPVKEGPVLPPMDNKIIQKKLEFAQLDTKIKEGYGLYSVLVNFFLLATIGLFFYSLSDLHSLVEFVPIALKALKINALYLARQAKREANLNTQATCVKQFRIILIAQIVMFAFFIYVNWLILPFMFNQAELIKITKDEIPNEVKMEVDPEARARMREMVNKMQLPQEEADFVVEELMQNPGFIILEIYEIILTWIWSVFSILSMIYMYLKSKEILELLTRRKALLQTIPTDTQPRN